MLSGETTALPGGSSRSRSRPRAAVASAELRGFGGVRRADFSAAALAAPSTRTAARAAASTLAALVHRLIPHDIPVLDFPDPAFVDQQIGVADHLGEGEEGLGDGDVAPDRLCDLVAGAGLVGDQAVDLLLAALVLGEAIVDQGDVVDDRVP